MTMPKHIIELSYVSAMNGGVMFENKNTTSRMTFLPVDAREEEYNLFYCNTYGIPFNINSPVNLTLQTCKVEIPLLDRTDPGYYPLISLEVFLSNKGYELPVPTTAPDDIIPPDMFGNIEDATIEWKNVRRVIIERIDDKTGWIYAEAEMFGMMLSEKMRFEPPCKKYPWQVTPVDENGDMYSNSVYQAAQDHIQNEKLVLLYPRGENKWQDAFEEMWITHGGVSDVK